MPVDGSIRSQSAPPAVASALKSAPSMKPDTTGETYLCGPPLIEPIFSILSLLRKACILSTCSSLGAMLMVSSGLEEEHHCEGKPGLIYCLQLWRDVRRPVWLASSALLTCQDHELARIRKDKRTRVAFASVLSI